jgi:hypothetical protein
VLAHTPANLSKSVLFSKPSAMLGRGAGRFVGKTAAFFFGWAVAIRMHNRD